MQNTQGWTGDYLSVPELAARQSGHAGVLSEEHQTLKTGLLGMGWAWGFSRSASRQARVQMVSAPAKGLTNSRTM